MDEPTVAACQLSVADLDVEANRQRVEQRVRNLDDEVCLAAFPEQTLTGFVPDERIHDAAIDRNADVLGRLRDVAVEEQCALTVGFVEDGDDGYYNATAYVSRDGTVTYYRKRHRWGAERDLLEPGDDRVTVETPLGTAGLVTCYDLNFVAESAAFVDEKVDALLVAGAWPAAHSGNWRLLCRARALDGVRWVLAAGRTGERDVADAPPATYAGRSLAVHPNGRVKTSLTRREDDLVVTCPQSALDDARRRIGVFEEDTW